MTNQVLWYCLALLLAPVAHCRPAEGEGSGDTSAEQLATDGDVVLVPVGAEDRLDYKIENDDGAYQYGYQSGPLGPEGGHSFRHEYRREDGVLFGSHGYQLPGGLAQKVNYVADGRGYRVLADGQQYEPASEEQLARQRHLLDGLLKDGEEELVLSLDLSLMDKIQSPEQVRMSADPEEALAAVPLQPYSELDPDTGAYRFGYRSVSEAGSVTLRQETRRPDGVVIGRFGQRTAGQPGSLVLYVSDVFGYRQVQPEAGSVKVVSREQALRQLPEARSQLAQLRAAAEAEAEGMYEKEMGSDGMEIMAGLREQQEMTKSIMTEAEEDAVAVDVDGAVGAESVVVGVATGAAISDDAVVTEALPQSVVEPADPQSWAGTPLYAAGLPYHVAAYPYLNGVTAYQYQTVHQPGYRYQQYQWVPYSAWYPYLTTAPTVHRYQYRQQPAAASYVRAKYQYPAPEFPQYEPHLYTPIVTDDHLSR